MVFIQIMMVLVHNLDFFPLCLIVFWHEIFLFMTILFSNFAMLPWICWSEALMSRRKMFYIIWPLLTPWRCLSLANHLKQVERYISLLWWHSFMFVFFCSGHQHNYKCALPLPHQLLVLNQLSKSLIFVLIVHVPRNNV